MRVTHFFRCVVAIALLHAAMLCTQAQTSMKPKRIIIAAGTVFDGKGHVLHNTRIVIEGSQIVAIDGAG
jgi:hypothetical protein